MPLDQLSGIFIVSAFIRYTNTPDFFFFFFFLRGAPDWHSGLVVKYYVLKCLCLSSGQCFWSPLPLGPIPDQDPGNVRHLRRVSGAARRFSLKVKLKKVRQKKRGNASAIQNTFFNQTGDILPTKYCQMLANSTYFSYPAPWNLGLLQHSRHIIDWLLLFFFDPGSPGRNEPNIHSVFCFFFPSREKCFLWYKCNITGHKSFRNSFGNHLKNTFIWEGGRGHQ